MKATLVHTMNAYVIFVSLAMLVAFVPEVHAQGFVFPGPFPHAPHVAPKSTPSPPSLPPAPPTGTVSAGTQASAAVQPMSETTRVATPVASVLPSKTSLASSTATPTTKPVDLPVNRILNPGAGAASGTNGTINNDPSEESKKSSGVIIPAVIGAFAGTFVLSGVLLAFKRRSNNKSRYERRGSEDGGDDLYVPEERISVAESQYEFGRMSTYQGKDPARQSSMSEHSVGNSPLLKSQLLEIPEDRPVFSYSKPKSIFTNSFSVSRPQTAVPETRRQTADPLVRVSFESESAYTESVRSSNTSEKMTDFASRWSSPGGVGAIGAGAMKRISTESDEYTLNVTPYQREQEQKAEPKARKSSFFAAPFVGLSFFSEDTDFVDV